MMFFCQQPTIFKLGRPDRVTLAHTHTGTHFLSHSSHVGRGVTCIPRLLARGPSPEAADTALAPICSHVRRHAEPHPQSTLSHNSPPRKGRCLHGRRHSSLQQRRIAPHRIPCPLGVSPMSLTPRRRRAGTNSGAARGSAQGRIARRDARTRPPLRTPAPFSPRCVTALSTNARA